MNCMRWHFEKVYYYYPWKSLLKSGTKGVATSEYGRKLMLEMMMEYDGDQGRYAKLSGHGFRILAEAMRKICHMKSNVQRY